jgi:hypothetical protein
MKEETVVGRKKEEAEKCTHALLAYANKEKLLLGVCITI